MAVQIVLYSMISILLLSPMAMYGEQEQSESSSFYKKIERNYMSSIPWEDEEWPNESFYDYLMRCMRYQKNPQEFKKLRAAFKIISSSKHLAQITPSYVLDDTTTWSDLCLFKGQHEGSTSLITIINRTETKVGQATLALMLAQPITDIQELNNRQKIVKELVDNPELLEQLDKSLKEFASCENFIMSFWWQDPFQQSAKRHYFNFNFLGKINETLNESVVALDLKTGLEHTKRMTWFLSTSLAAAVLPAYGASILTQVKAPNSLTDLAQELRGSGGPIFALVGKIPFGVIQGLSTTMAGIYCGLTAKEDYEWARDNALLDTLLQEKLMACATGLRTIKSLAKVIEATPLLKDGLPHVESLAEFLYERPKNSPQFKQLCSLLKSSTFKGEPSLWSRPGRVLVGYSLMHETKDEWVQALAMLGELDAYVSIAKLYKEFQDKPQRYCFAEFQKAEKPTIALHDFWNPFLRTDNIVVNSVALGEGADHKDIILTGPNAGGKSTVLRAIAINLILAQSFGIAPASQITITPCSFIATYLNITDDIDAGKSLFKSEVLRAQHIINKLSSLPKDHFSFIIVDEMFSGTSPEEGQAAAYSVAKHLGEYDNNLCIIATHYAFLTKLEEECGYYANYKVSVDLRPDGTLHYPFTLQRGASNQHIAIDILRAEGFDGTVLDQAYALINRPK